MGDQLRVEAMDWQDDFLPWFKDAWQPGEHVSVIAHTGAGKTTFVGGILHGRRYVLVPDAKGGDTTLGVYGFPRLEKWPGQREMAKTVLQNDNDDLPSRYIIGNFIHARTDEPKLVATIRAMLDDAYEMRGWTVYADELMMLTDPRQYNLRSQVDRMLIAARDRAISFVGSFQSTTWVTPMAHKQSTWVAVSYTRDTDVVNRLAEVLGRPKAEIRGAIEALDKYCWLIVGRDPRDPIRVTIPDYVERKVP